MSAIIYTERDHQQDICIEMAYPNPSQLWLIGFFTSEDKLSFDKVFSLLEQFCHNVFVLYTYFCDLF